MLKWLSLAVLFGTTMAGVALESGDLLFHLSFENGVMPELARGCAQPATMPTELDRRLVDGLFGKGYLFAGKGSTIEYLTGAGEPRACAEMYGPRANLFGDSGSFSVWIKPLPNLHNMQHMIVRCWPIDLGRGPWGAFGINYGGKSGYVYDGIPHPNEWMHFVLTWRENDARAYLNGHVMTSIAETGVVKPTPPKVIVAAEGLTWLDFQKKEFEDDMVMDELQFFRRPLTPEEVQSLFERGHLTLKTALGVVPDKQVSAPERGYAANVFVAPRVPAPIVADGNMADWATVAPQAGFIERRLGVLDDDPGKVYAACDDQNLYLGFACEVDAAIQKDPTHVMYPAGEFLATPCDRDGEVYADDYVEFVIRSGGGHEYRLALNARGSLRDARDGDVTWNPAATWKGRSDFKDWTAELVVPLADLDLKTGQAMDFNVIRSWKLFKSSQNSLCTDEHWLPGFGTCTLGGAAAASLEALGVPGQGDLAVRGTITGPAGDYTVKVAGKGFTTETKVTVAAAATPFDVKRRLDKPADMSVIVTVADPAGQPILVRSIPFVYVAASTVELANYPGWGRLEATVAPAGVEFANLQATVAVMQGDKVVLGKEIPEFANSVATIVFETNPLAVGNYDIVTTLRRGTQVIGEDRQPFEKKPLPAWYGSTAGEIDRPPMPWTAVTVKGDNIFNRLTSKSPRVTVQCLLKDITFTNTLLPAEIVANGQSLLAAPVRIRVQQNGVERVIAAGQFQITEKTPRRAGWTAVASDGDLQIKVTGWIEFDGLTWMDVTFSGGKVDHLSVEVPMRREAATLKGLDGIGLLDKPLKTPGCLYWFGNENAGLQYIWPDQRDWVLNGENVTVTPTETEVVLAIPVLQKAVDLAKPRTISLGLAITPSKPIRKDWRMIKLYRQGVSYLWGDYTMVRPNYPSPMSTQEGYELIDKQSNSPAGPITMWYAYGTSQWVGSPEYADWWREWRWIPSDLARPDPNSVAWAPACPNSSAADMHSWMLENFVRSYPQNGIYFDCKQIVSCANESHGCGYVDEKDTRQPAMQVLALRRFYERIYNIIKAKDPVYGWVRHHDWIVDMPTIAFADDNWVGEGHIGGLIASAEKNYYHVVDLPAARYYFLDRHWGHLTSWLTEMACTAGTDKEKRAEFYGKMVSPPKDGKHGEWILPRWKDYEHVAGLGLIHDMWSVGGNDMQLPWMWFDEVERMMKWDEQVKFVGYWELGDLLQVEGGVPEKIVCSLFYRPAGLPKPDVPEIGPRSEYSWQRFTVGDETKAFLRHAGENPKGWLVLVPMNNTDEDVTITLRPNLRKLGVMAAAANARLKDIHRAFDFTWQAAAGWRANDGDPEEPLISIKGEEHGFALDDGAARVTVPRRNFRALLLETGK